MAKLEGLQQLMPTSTTNSSFRPSQTQEGPNVKFRTQTTWDAPTCKKCDQRMGSYTTISQPDKGESKTYYMCATCGRTSYAFRTPLCDLCSAEMVFDPAQSSPPSTRVLVCSGDCDHQIRLDESPEMVAIRKESAVLANSLTRIIERMQGTEDE